MTFPPLDFELFGPLFTTDAMRDDICDPLGGCRSVGCVRSRRRPLPPRRVGSILRCGTLPLSASASCPKTTILPPSSNRRFR
jgi:hypothetical protein